MAYGCYVGQEMTHLEGATAVGVVGGHHGPNLALDGLRNARQRTRTSFQRTSPSWLGHALRPCRIPAGNTQMTARPRAGNTLPSELG